MKRLTKVVDGRVVFPDKLVGITLTPDNEVMHSLLTRLAAYEDTGLEPDELNYAKDEAFDLGYQSCLRYKGLNWTEAEELQRYRELGPIDHLRELVQAEHEGRLVVLPCKDTVVYTVEENSFDCEACEYEKDPYCDWISQRLRCIGLSRKCPMCVKEHVVEGFCVSFADGKPVLSTPGEYSWEGFEPYSGIDGKWYLTREEAEAALEAQKGGDDG